MQILSCNPEDDTFFVGLSLKEFERLSLEYNIEYDLQYDLEQTKQIAFQNLNKTDYIQMIKEAYNIKSAPFVCVVVNRNVSEIAVRPSHFPFSNLWNGYSPWKAIQAQEIDSLEVLKNTKKQQ
ncbi:MAG: hypothetical protein IJF40_02460 [Clostridia bacterium]|nr:hypothetical protein [Clostridia bacterium]